MDDLRQTSKKELAVIVCSLLAMVQPVSECAAAAPWEQRPASPAALVAVAEVVGAVQRNGSPLLNGSIVTSGDVVATQRNSALLLASAPEEKLWIGPGTIAKLSKSSADISVSLQGGTLKFLTVGHVSVTFAQYEGLAIRSRPGLPASAQLSFTNGQSVRVNVEAGSLELIQGGEWQLLEPGRQPFAAVTGTLPTTPQSATDNSQIQPNGENTGSLHGEVVDKTLVAVSGASITLTNAQGSSYITVSDNLGHFGFRNVPPGTYTLHVIHAGFPDYEMHDVAVTSGVDSSAYVQLQAGGAASGGHNHGLIIALVAGGAAAGGIGAWAASKGKSSSVSPTTTP